MSRFGIVGPSYSSQSLNADAQRTLNWYVEQIESGRGKNALALYPTPGLAAFCTLGGGSANNSRGPWSASIAYNPGDTVSSGNTTFVALAASIGIPPFSDPTHWLAIPTNNGPVRGIYGINGRVFAVGGTMLFEVLTNGKSIARGSVMNDGLPASMTASPAQLLIASGGTAYVFDLTANTLSTLAAETLTNVNMVGFSDGFFIALIHNSQKFQVSAAEDATTWPGANAAIVSVFPDNVLAMLVDHREIWLWGASKSVAYYDSGGADFPYDVVPGGFIEQGIIAPASAVRLDNSVYWLGADERGGGIGWRAQGYVPARVSNHAVETALQSYATVSDAIGYAYQDQGHSFWVLYFPSANKTWAYDVATQMWHERGFWDAKNSAFTAHRSQCHAYGFGKHLVGDWASGTIYQMAVPTQNGSGWSFADDFGNSIRRLRRAPHISTEQQWMFHHEIQVDVEAGLGPIPPLPGAFSGPQTITLQDSNLGLWNLTVTDAGILQTTKIQPGAAVPEGIILNDQTVTNTSWLLGISSNGMLTLTAAVFNSGNPMIFALSTSPGQLYTTISVAGGMLQTRAPTAYGRDPQLVLRWSDDSGKTWSNERLMNCGQAGAFKTRAIARRLGRSRDRIYEISASDPVPWRIVEAYLRISEL
jgi:hypothetical protein